VSSQLYIEASLDVLLTSSIRLGFWQYGLIDWELFYGCVRSFIIANDDWAIFQYDEDAPGQRRALYSPNHEIPRPGTYIILQPGILAIDDMIAI
jgi:hypothetical protein